MKRPNYLFSILSTATILFFIGGMMLIWLYGRIWLREYKEQVQVMVEFRENTSQNTIDSMRQILKNKPYLRPQSMRFIPRDEAAKMMREELGEDFLTSDINNPLLDMIVFKTTAEYAKHEQLEVIKADIEHEIQVQEVNYDEKVVRDLNRNFDGLGKWLLLFIIPLLLMNIYLIYNKMRFVAATTNEEETDNKLTLIRSAINGLWSGLLAIGALAAVGYWLQGVLPELSDFTEDAQPLLWVLFGVLGVALLLHVGIVLKLRTKN